MRGRECSSAHFHSRYEFSASSLPPFTHTIAPFAQHQPSPHEPCGGRTAASAVGAADPPRCSRSRATRSFGRRDSPYNSCRGSGNFRGRSGDGASNSRACPPRCVNRGLPTISRSLSRMSGSPTTTTGSSPTFWDCASTSTCALATLANPFPTGNCGLAAIADSRAAIDG
jgi:hypothetical protein